jgi:ADP-ribosylglycohydrolase
MLGAIAGDIIGSVHEFCATKSADFSLFVPESRFTDDTVLAVAVADCLLNGKRYVDAFHEYFVAYPNAGYGLRFFHWANAGRRDAYHSFGNGSAMRVPAVGYAFNYVGVPPHIVEPALQTLDDRLRNIVQQFCQRHPHLRASSR